MKCDNERLCIRLQPAAKGRWFRNVGYPQGLVYEYSEADTSEAALATAVVAHRLLTATPRPPGSTQRGPW